MKSRSSASLPLPVAARGRGTLASGVIALLVSVALASTAAPAHADVTLEFSDAFTGATPSGTGPYFRATFEDTGSGTVQLTLENLLNAAAEFVSSFAFNFAGSGTLNATNFTGTQNLATFGSGAGPGIGGGNGNFDYHFDFPNSNANGGIRRFKGGEIFEAILSSTAGSISASDFAAVDPSRGRYAAIHVQGISTPPGSGKLEGDLVAVPEPSPIILGLMAAAPMAAVGYLRRRRRRQAGTDAA